MAAHSYHRTVGLLSSIGVLRILLLLSTVAIIAAAPFADGTVHMHDWRLLPSVVAPSIMMMLVFAIPLDITMALVFMVDADADERKRLGFAIRLDLAMLMAMLIAWTPFVLKLVDLWPFD